MNLFDGWMTNRIPVQLQRKSQFRLLLTVAVITLLMFVLLARIFYLQIISYTDFAALSANNRLEIVPIAPVRGRIFDRNGILLAENKVVTQLGIVPSHAEDLSALLSEISDVIPVSEEEEKDFIRTVKRGSPFDMHILKDNLSAQQTARFAVDRYRLSGANLKWEFFRDYVHGELFAHVVGMVSRIDKNDLEKVNPARYRGLQYIGKYGVEKSNENVLVGWPGFEQIETNAHGQRIRRLSQELPTAGRDVYLSLDFDLQKHAFEALGDKKGAIVALEPSSGRVLAMVSKPGFDPNDFGIDSTSEKRKRWLNSEDSPLINRVVQGQYSPGSTIKPFIGLAALEMGISELKINCKGYYQLPGSDHKFRCWKKKGHGLVSLTEAIAESCDVYFYKLAEILGIDEIYYYLSKFGFGTYTGVDLEDELTGILPSKEWKRYQRNEPWYLADTIMMGIGQGATTVTALQLAHALSIVANKGLKVTPQIISKIVDVENGEELIVQPQLDDVLDLEARNFETIIKDMEKVVHSQRGTARGMGNGLKYRVAGKTGTVQLIQRAQDKEWQASEVPEKFQPHGIFIAFAPAENPQILVSAIVENGGSGAAVAPIVRSMMDLYLVDKPSKTNGDQFALLPR